MLPATAVQLLLKWLSRPVVLVLVVLMPVVLMPVVLVSGFLQRGWMALFWLAAVLSVLVLLEDDFLVAVLRKRRAL